MSLFQLGLPCRHFCTLCCPSSALISKTHPPSLQVKSFVLHASVFFSWCAKTAVGKVLFFLWNNYLALKFHQVSPYTKARACAPWVPLMKHFPFAKLRQCAGWIVTSRWENCAAWSHIFRIDRTTLLFLSTYFNLTCVFRVCPHRALRGKLCS